jgi:hypothetical protein
MKWTTLILIIAFSSLANSSPDAYGVDDWDTKRVHKFMKNAGVPLQLDVLEYFKFDGHMLMSIDTHMKMLNELPVERCARLRGCKIVNGLTDKEKAKLLAAVKSKQESIAKAPADVFEWRVANRRMADYFILPLLLSSHATLLWVRFSSFLHNNLEQVTDEIDDIPSLEFWFKFLVAPSWPLYQVASKLQTSCFVDTVIMYSFGLQAAAEATGFMGLLYAAAKGGTYNGHAMLGVKVHKLGMPAASKLLEWQMQGIKVLLLDFVPALTSYFFVLWYYYVFYWCTQYSYPVPTTSFFAEITFALVIYFLVPIKVKTHTHTHTHKCTDSMYL